MTVRENGCPLTPVQHHSCFPIVPDLCQTKVSRPCIDKNPSWVLHSRIAKPKKFIKVRDRELFRLASANTKRIVTEVDMPPIAKDDSLTVWYASIKNSVEN